MWQSSGGHTSARFFHAARLQVLQGTFLLFSGVIPLQQSPQEHPLWRMAVKFGARCTIEKHEDVTHVVAKSSLTEKVGCEHDVVQQAVLKWTEQANQARAGVLGMCMASWVDRTLCRCL